MPPLPARPFPTRTLLRSAGPTRRATLARGVTRVSGVLGLWCALAACTAGEPCTPGEPLPCTRTLDLSGQWEGADGAMGELRVTGSSERFRAAWFRLGPMDGEDRWLDTMQRRSDRDGAVSELVFEGRAEGSVEDGFSYRLNVKSQSIRCWPRPVGELGCKLQYELDVNGVVGSDVLQGVVRLRRTRYDLFTQEDERTVWSAPIQFTRNRPVTAPPPCPVCEERCLFGCGLQTGGSTSSSSGATVLQASSAPRSLSGLLGGSSSTADSGASSAGSASSVDLAGGASGPASSGASTAGVSASTASSMDASSGLPPSGASWSGGSGGEASSIP